MLTGSWDQHRHLISHNSLPGCIDDFVTANYLFMASYMVHCFKTASCKDLYTVWRVIFVGENFLENLNKAPRIKFRGFKFRGTMGGNMNFNLWTRVWSMYRFGSGSCMREATTSMKIFGRLVNARTASVLTLFIVTAAFRSKRER